MTLLFTDETLEGVTFKSSWKKERSLSDNYAQTKELLVEEVGVQSIEKFDEETQTDNEPQKHMRLGDDNSDRLLHFLTKVEPYVVQQLEKNAHTRAFDGYDVCWDESTSSVTCIHTLSHAALDEQFQVTGLSWNCTGSVMAASYGRFDHEDWCTHHTALCTWNLDRRNINESKPDTVIDQSSCLMCLAFHPKNPALVAGGNFSGEVMVWDLSREDDMLMATSGIGDDAHREPVSKVYWIPDSSSKGRKFSLVSVSGDGKILVWRLPSKSHSLKLVDGFVLMAQSLPRRMKVKGVRGDKEVGVTCISYSCENKDIFVVGSEAGAIFKCSMHAQGSPAGSHIVSSVPLRSPVTFTYSPHHGPVYAVECSPFHRNAFLSSAMDQCIRLYSLLQDQPVLTIEPEEGYIFSAKWSPVRPTVLAAATETGQLLIYDLKEGQPVIMHKLEASPNKAAVYSCQFNQNQSQLLATGDGAGYIRVFRLSDELRQTSSREMEVIGNLVSVATE